MAELQITPGIKFRGGDDENTLGIIGMAEIQRVWLWDLGPEKPIEPKKLVAPKGRDGDPQYELEKAEFQVVLEDYKEALIAFKKDKIEYAAWLKNVGGPIEVMFDSPSAREAQEADLRAVGEERQTRLRWAHVSSRTRGYAKLANRGLPDGVKPGHGQSEQERRIREGESDLVAARKTDPVFGQQELL
jgi:hypothetical protein